MLVMSLNSKLSPLSFACHFRGWNEAERSDLVYAVGEFRQGVITDVVRGLGGVVGEVQLLVPLGQAPLAFCQVPPAGFATCALQDSRDTAVSCVLGPKAGSVVQLWSGSGLFSVPSSKIIN